MANAHLLQRLEEIAASLASTGYGVALIGLGSVGVELARLDEYSDLDFFAIVQPGFKQHFLQNLGWLNMPCPIAYSFRNTPDGYKLLYTDGIFCEMAVFEEAELATIPFAEGRIIWKAVGVEEAIRLPTCRPASPSGPLNAVEWLLGEALTCLYVGLQRYWRGEKLSAQRFVQHYAVDRVLELGEVGQWQAGAAPRDPFAIERRYEQRYPDIARHLPDFVQGYERTPESAQALLAFLEAHFSTNSTMRDRIQALCQRPDR
jgi:lincosamide nucleotidyltransferase B/F